MCKEKIIIVHLNKDINITESQLESKINEIKELVRSANSEVVSVVIQNMSSINPKYYTGSGKVQEIKELAEIKEANTILFNNELTGSQIKNLEDIIDKKIIDRTGLILDIFAKRAKTNESKLQIKLAQLEYRLPRLVGFRKYLSREGAGIGTKGPGEQKLEIDRRTIQAEINSIKHKLKNEFKKRKIKKSKRINSKMPIVSLIGYSNAGKSTILNQIINKYSDNSKIVYSDNLLFATLDVSARKIKLKNNKNIIITDTVGFISDLPTRLVESFKSTIEEIEDSNLIIIVIDASNEYNQIQINATLDILKDMNLENKEVLYVFNKIDMNRDFKYFGDLKNELYISAFDDNDIDNLVKKIEEILFNDFKYYKALIPYSEYDKFFELIPKENNEEQYLEEGIITKLYLDLNKKEKFRRYIIDVEGI